MRHLNRVVQEVNFPHGVHPALVPGVSVDDQRIRYRTDKVVFGVTGVAVIAFILWGLINTKSLTKVSDLALTWVVHNTGWLFNILAIVAVVFMLVVALSRYGNVKLGRDDEEPEFTRTSWLAMLFSAGMGIGLLFFGSYEPMTYYLSPPPNTVEPESIAAMHTAMAQTIYHWGANAWAMYALVGGAVAYAAYRRGRPALMSSLLVPLIGEKRSSGAIGRSIDIFAIIATLFGTAVSLGIGALQIGRGIEIVGGISDLGLGVIIAIILVLSVGFILSAVSGVSRGIRWLSNINMVLAFVLGLFIFLAGPTLFLLNFMPSAAMEYVNELPMMMGRSASWGAESDAFISAWTVFYWAWWVSWTPFVGIFIARISRGRTIREFVSVVLVVPTIVCFLAFGISGGTAMHYQYTGRADIAGAQSPQDMLFRLLDALPLSSISAVLVMVMLSVFFITSADSASLVMGMLSQQGKPEPTRWVTIFWGAMLAGIAIVMLLVGGDEALKGLQNLIIVSALPFMFVLFAMMASWLLELRTDPATIRRAYAQEALEHAVDTGVRQHGDDFALAVAATDPGEGVGSQYDWSNEKLTSWYQRTDEDGLPIEYDYETGSYVEDSDDTEAEEAEGETSSTE